MAVPALVVQTNRRRCVQRKSWEWAGNELGVSTARPQRSPFRAVFLDQLQPGPVGWAAHLWREHVQRASGALFPAGFYPRGTQLVRSDVAPGRKPKLSRWGWWGGTRQQRVHGPNQVTTAKAVLGTSSYPTWDDFQVHKKLDGWLQIWELRSARASC